MVEVAGIRFKKVGKIYYFSPGKLKLNIGDHVIVETSRGIEYGTVAVPLKNVSDEDIVPPLKSILRIATPDDDKQIEINREKEKEAIDAWKLTHEEEAHGGNSYSGSIGGRYSYHFVPTSVGTSGVVRCSCGAEFEFCEIG